MWTRLRRTRSLSLLLFLSGIGCSYDNDFDQLCRIAGELEVDTTVPREEKFRAALERWMPLTQQGARLHQTVLRQPNDVAHDVIVDAAYDGWSCRALDAIADPE